MRSGFNGFQTKSSKSFGLSNPVDSFGSIKNAILSILNNTNTQIFSVAETKNFVADSSGVVSRWDPTYAPTANLHLTQSTSTNRMSFTSTYKLGKYDGLRSVTDDWYYQESPEPTSTTNKSYFIYYRQPTVGAVGAIGSDIAHSNYGTNDLGQSLLKTSGYLQTYNNGNSLLGAGLQPTNKLARILQSGAGQLMVNTTNNMFRVFRASINTQRTASISLQNENFDLLGSATNPLNLATSNGSSFTYTQASISTYTTGNWDFNFPSNQFGASKFFIGYNSAGGDRTYFGIVYVPSDVTAEQTLRVKYIFDKVHGVV